jgi:hypothetical protein
MERRFVEATVAPPKCACQAMAVAPAFNSGVFAFLASGQNRIVS